MFRNKDSQLHCNYIMRNCSNEHYYYDCQLKKNPIRPQLDCRLMGDVMIRRCISHIKSRHKWTTNKPTVIDGKILFQIKNTDWLVSLISTTLRRFEQGHLELKRNDMIRRCIAHKDTILRPFGRRSAATNRSCDQLVQLSRAGLTAVWRLQEILFQLAKQY